MNVVQGKTDSKCFNCGVKFEDENEFQKHVFVCNGSSSENMAENGSIDLLKSTSYSWKSKEEANLTSNFDIVDKSEEGLSLCHPNSILTKFHKTLPSIIGCKVVTYKKTSKV